MIDKIVAEEYIDFNDLPPARGLSKAVPPYLEGQVIIVQAEQLTASQKLIPNLETWSWCSALFAAVIIACNPSRAEDLMAYSYSIAAMAKSILGHCGSSMTKNLGGRSPFGVIPKKGKVNKWRLILKLSPPADWSINDKISKEDCSLQYASMSQVAAKNHRARERYLAG